MKRPPNFQLPPDTTATEMRILESAYAHVYRNIPDPLDKFIVAFMFDMGNDSTTTALACGLSRKAIWQRHTKIKQMLEGFRLDKSYFEDDVE